MPLFHSHSTTADDNDDSYSVIPVIPTDEIVHSPEYPFCGDPRCPCHEDPDAIAETNNLYEAGLYTAPEATRRVKGWRL